MRGIKGYLILIIAACFLIQPLSAACPYCTTTPVPTQVSVSSSPQVTIDILDLNGQYVKITNNGPYVVSLNVWSLKNQDSSLKFVFPHFLLNSGSSVWVYAGNGIDSNKALYTHNMFDAWNTNGDTASLYDSQGNLISKKYQNPGPKPTPTLTLIPSSHLYAYYTFDDGTATDSSIYSHNGIVHGAVLTEGVKGKALYFDGKSNYVELPFIFDKDPYQITLMALFRPDSKRTEQIVYNGNFECGLGIEDMPEKERIYSSVKLSETGWFNLYSPFSYDGETWHHVAGVYDPYNRNTRLYVDGVQKDSFFLPEGTFYSPDGYLVSIGAYTYKNKNYLSDAIKTRLFHGAIDEVRFYRGALSSEDIAAIYKSYFPNPTPTPTSTPITKPTVVPTTSVPTIVPTITSQPTGSGIKAAFSASPRSGSLPLEVRFSDQSTGNPKTWSWSFGDGSYSNEKNPVYTYSEPGSYTVSLKVTGSGGSSSSEKYGYIVVYDPANPPPFAPTQLPTPIPTQTTIPTAVPTTPITTTPTVTPTVTSGKLVADFTSNVRSGGLPLEVSFRDTSSGSPNKWFWSFGDGSYSEEQNPVHTYADQLSYSVSLEVKKDGNTATIVKGNWITVS